MTGWNPLDEPACVANARHRKLIETEVIESLRRSPEKDATMFFVRSA
jgi:hypothetical protein